ncbi:hypothetical protein BgiBS90_029054 [Biomphalaria glabrata]|nr:hypothetical protein BgiBS90_029054 [Biomphalaria glabrata]
MYSHFKVRPILVKSHSVFIYLCLHRNLFLETRHDGAANYVLFCRVACFYRSSCIAVFNNFYASFSNINIYVILIIS